MLRKLSYLTRVFDKYQKKILHSWASCVVRYPITALGLCLLISVVATFYVAENLVLVTGRNDLVSADKRYLQLDEEYSSQFVGIDHIVVVIEPVDLSQGKAFVSQLARQLEQRPEHFTEALYRVDIASLDGKKLLYLDTSQLVELRENIQNNRDLIETLLERPGLNTLLEAIDRQTSEAAVAYLVEDLFGLGPDTSEATIRFTNFHVSFLGQLFLEMSRALDGGDYRYRSPWTEYFGGFKTNDEDGYLVSHDGKYIFLMITATEDVGAGFNDLQASMGVIRSVIAQTKENFPGLEAGVTGTKALGNDEMLSAQRDTAVATVVSLSGIVLLYILFFRRVRHPIFIVVSLVVGLSWTMGFVVLAVGHLTIITVFVAPMLLGLADDFGVHFMTRYEEERSAGREMHAAITIVFDQTAPSIIAGAVTTSLAFLAVMLADFRGVQELGIISSGGILLCLVSVLIFLPALIVSADAVSPWRAASKRRVGFDGTFRIFGEIVDRRRGVLFALVGMATVAGAYGLKFVSFDYNLLNLQAHGTESVEWEKRIIENSERSSWHALATADTLHAAREKAQAFSRLPSVATTESFASLVPEHQDQRLELVRSLSPIVTEMPNFNGDVRPLNLPLVYEVLDKLRLKIRDQTDGTSPDLGVLRRRLLDVVTSLREIAEPAAIERLTSLQDLVFSDFQRKWKIVAENVLPKGEIVDSDIPTQLSDRFVSRDGRRYLIQIYPRENIWERGPLEEFVDELRSVDEDVTGSPVIGYESIRAMKDGYVEAAFYAAIAIFFVTILALGRVQDALLAMLPLIVGMLWTAALMWLLNLKFNLANMVAAPLIIGIGVENGIHLVQRFREDPNGSAADLIAGSTGQAVVLFSLTTMVGFGSLMVADYYGMFSIGLLLSLAVGCVLVASNAMLPVLLYQLRDHEKGAQKIW